MAKLVWMFIRGRNGLHWSKGWKTQAPEGKRSWPWMCFVIGLKELERKHQVFRMQHFTALNYFTTPLPADSGWCKYPFHGVYFFFVLVMFGFLLRKVHSGDQGCSQPPSLTLTLTLATTTLRESQRKKVLVFKCLLSLSAPLHSCRFRLGFPL